jgi:hypothetical protein
MLCIPKPVWEHISESIGLKWLLERRTEVNVPPTIDKKEELRDKLITSISKLSKSIGIRDDEIRKCEIDVRTYKERGRKAPLPS